MKVRVKKGCSLGTEEGFLPEGTEVELEAQQVVKYAAVLEPADDAAASAFELLGLGG